MGSAVKVMLFRFCLELFTRSMNLSTFFSPFLMIRDTCASAKESIPVLVMLMVPSSALNSGAVISYLIVPEPNVFLIAYIPFVPFPTAPLPPIVSRSSPASFWILICAFSTGSESSPVRPIEKSSPKTTFSGVVRSTIVRSLKISK